MNERNQLTYSIVILVLVTAVGVVGYQRIEGWSYFDSLYMTVITLATIGYGEVRPLSQDGRMFTIFLILLGVGAVAYAIRNATKAMLEGELREVLGRRKVERKIKALKNHYIVCGYGRMGKIVCKELLIRHVPFVVIENSTDVLSGLSDESALLIQGDSTQDHVLEEAGVRRAKGLISVLSSDADNLYVVLSARSMNEKLIIVARSGTDGSEQKLLRAGANKVVSPYHIGGTRIAHAMLKPAVVDFLELATQSENLELQMEELTVGEGSSFAHRTLNDCGIRRELNVIIVAIKRIGGHMEFNPTADTFLRAGDTLIVLGQGEQLKKLEKLMG